MCEAALDGLNVIAQSINQAMINTSGQHSELAGLTIDSERLNPVFQ